MALALVNTTHGENSASANSLAATAASHTSGNLLIVGVTWFGNSTNANVPTDTAGNTYVSTGIKTGNTTTGTNEIFYAKNITGNASNVVTAHWAASVTFRGIVVHQVSGADTSAPFTTGEGGTAQGTGLKTITTTSWTTATANEYLFGYLSTDGVDAAGLMHPATGYTFEISSQAGANYTMDQIVAATGTYTAGANWSDSQGAVLVGASFKQAGGGSTKSITPATINATSAVTGAIQKLAAIAGSISATSAVTGSVAKLFHLAAASINATSAITGTVVALRAIKPAAINATSALTGAVTKLGTKAIVPAALNATSAVTASVQALRRIGGAVINSTSSVTGTVTGPVQPALQFINRVIRWHRHR